MERYPQRLNLLSLIIFFFCFIVSLNSQDRKLDSLTRLFPKSHDTLKVQILCSVSRIYEANDPVKALKLADSALHIAQKAKYNLGIGGAYGNIGSCLCTAGKYDEAINALIKALKIFESEKSKRHITNTYNSLANAYLGLKNNDKAYEYFLKAYNLAKEEPKNTFMIAVAGVGVGNMLLEKNEFKKAIEYFKTSEDFFRENNVPNYQAMCITMIGESYIQDSNYVEAEKYFLKSLPIFKNSNDEYGYAINLGNLGGIEVHKKNYNEAARYFEEALKLNLKRNAFDNIQNTALGLSQVKELQNKPLEALAAYKIFMQYKDSVINVERNKSIADAESKYESEKKEQALKLKNLELEKSQTKVRQRNTLIYFFIAAFALVGGLLLLVFIQYRQKKKANSVLENQFREISEKNMQIEHQKNVIEEKNKDITDSINYSKHIQQAILPSENLIQRTLPNSYFIYKPKDIISGDFYFIENTYDYIYFAVVDCTGHGVPGALLSVFAQNTLKKIISTKKLLPNQVLSEICKEFKMNLGNQDVENMSINDGMDIALACIDKYKNKLYFSGAKNPLLLSRGEEMLELRADRWGISGRNENEMLNFTHHEVELQKGDKIYLFSDGIIDQFGGPKGKKFKYKQLQDLLRKASRLILEEQKSYIENQFESWKGSLEQLDDVTLMCVSL
jgi:serine phosphatase RsbU (regulator of sigma subunit)